MTIEKALEQGIAHHNAGRWAQAESIYRQVLSQVPNQPDALHLLGALARDTGNNEAAVDLIGRAIAVAPNQSHFHSSLGVALANLGRRDEAMAALQRAHQLNPSSPEILNNFGNVLFADTARVEEAAAAYRQALALDPKFADAHNNLGNCLLRMKKTDEAIAEYKLATSPEFPQAYYNLAYAYLSANRPTEAIDAYRQAIQLDPRDSKAWNNLGNALKETAQPTEAVNAYRQAMSLGHNLHGAHSNLLYTLHLVPDADPEMIYREHLEWDRRHSAALLPKNLPREIGRGHHQKLRIGYVSPDFREHSVAYFLDPLIAHFDKQAFEVYCYGDLQTVDEYTTKYQSLATAFRNITGMTDDAAADLIRKDQIDILVDLAGHTSGHRLLVFARKPAPIQATYLGYPDTTGLSAMDFRITDGRSDPAGTTERFHTEKLIRLPDTFLCFTPPTGMPPAGPPPCERNGHITFGCFNALGKINETLIGWWGDILNGCAGSKLIIKTRVLSDPPTADRFRALFEKRGMYRDRVDFLPWAQFKHHHLGCYDLVDVALDTYPYHGTTTTCEAMWMGVPVVTLAGETHCRRVGASLLGNIGLDDFVAQSPGEYVEIAVRAAGNRKRLAELRLDLRRRMSESPLTDSIQFARNIENVYRLMVEMRGLKS